MPENPRKIRRRIQSVKNTKKITSAMKMVAAARLRRAEERVKTARPYAERIQLFISTLFTDSGTFPHPLAEQRPAIRRTGLLVITSDRGLCGAYNANVLRAAHHFLNERGNDKVSLVLVGRKGYDYFRRRGAGIARYFTGIDPAIVYREIKDISDTLSKSFLAGETDEVKIASSRYVSPAVCRPGIYPLLPLSAEKPAEQAAKKTGALVQFIFQPSPEEILNTLFPKYLYTRIVLALAESFASEQGQRMVAMTTATDNAAEMIDKLTLYYNKVRQAAITKEISEIVGGAEALK